MSLFSRLFRFGRSTTDDSPNMRLLRSIRQQLLDSNIPAAAGVAIQERLLVFLACKLVIAVEVIEITAEKVHAHVVAWLPNLANPEESDELDACVLGYGPDAVEQAASIWLRLAGAPILSYISGRFVLDADHFAGQETWGVPGGHGFVGPFMVRGDTNPLDMSELSISEAFRFDGYPRDGKRHLVKATLIAREGVWTRHLEIDGHAITHVDEDWRGGPPAPMVPVVCVRFAVFDMIK